MNKQFAEFFTGLFNAQRQDFERNRQEREMALKEKKVFTEEEFTEFLKPYATNNYLFEKQIIDGKIYYIKLN